MFSLSLTFAETPLIIYSHFLLLPEVTTGQWKTPVQGPSANQGRKNWEKFEPRICSVVAPSLNPPPSTAPLVSQGTSKGLRPQISAIETKTRWSHQLFLLSLCISSGQWKAKPASTIFSFNFNIVNCNKLNSVLLANCFLFVQGD